MCEGTADEDFPTPIKDAAPQIQVSFIPGGMSGKETVRRHIAVTLLEIEDEQAI